MRSVEYDLTQADRRRLWRQIILLYAALEGALWTAADLQIVFTVVVAGIVVGATLRERRFWPLLGLAPSSIGGGLWFAPVAAGVAAVILFGASRAHTLRLPTDTELVYVNAGTYLVWAFVQQFILQSFLFLRLEALLGGGFAAVGAGAVLFCVAHIPNPVLMPVTFAGGLVLCELFRRYRTLYVLALAHALVALSLTVSVPETALNHSRVGRAYFLPADPRRSASVFAIDPRRAARAPPAEPPSVGVGLEARAVPSAPVTTGSNR